MFYYETGAAPPRPIADAWGFDGVSWRRIIGVWGVDEALQWRTTAVNLGAVTCTVAPIDAVSAKVSWNVVGATTIDVYVNGILVHQRIYSQVVTSPVPAVGSHTQSGLVPGSQISAHIVAGFQATKQTQQVPTVAVMPPLSVPPNFVATDVTSTSMVLSWGAVTGATTYSLYQKLTSPAVWAPLQDSPITYCARTGLSPNTEYQHMVRAKYGSTNQGDTTPILKTKTLLAFKPGTYVFKATVADTWQATKQAWRGTAAGELYHGNGQKWYGNSIGDQTAFFFNYRMDGQTIPGFFGGVPVNLNKLEIYVTRKSSNHGLNSAQACRFWMHKHGTKPTTPTAVGPAYNNGSLTRGQGAWIPLPLDWAKSLMSASINGFAWGGTPFYADGARYMVGPSLSAASTMGQLRFTIV
jgi:Fibronectin type III domain